MKKRRQLLKVVGESNTALLNNEHLGSSGENKSPQVFNKAASTLNSENMLCQSPQLIGFQ